MQIDKFKNWLDEVNPELGNKIGPMQIWDGIIVVCDYYKLDHPLGTDIVSSSLDKIKQQIIDKLEKDV